MTAFYMFRVFLLTFFGDFRGTSEQEHHLHESPSIMTVPLMVLAVLSVFGGFIGMPEIFSEHHWLKEYLSNRLSFPAGFIATQPSHQFEYSVVVVSVFVLLAVWLYTKRLYVDKRQIPSINEREFNSATRLLYNKYYVDEIYQAIVVKPLMMFSSLAYRLLDNKVIDGLINSFGSITVHLSNLFRKMQTGNTGYYIFAMVLSIIAILIVNLYLI
jgi:NADH-quinone oxidoreductase subunit L